MFLVEAEVALLVAMRIGSPVVVVYLALQYAALDFAVPAAEVSVSALTYMDCRSTSPCSSLRL